MLVAALTVALVARPTQADLLLLLAAIVLSFLALAFNGLYEQDDVGPGHSTPDEIIASRSRSRSARGPRA